MHKLNNQSAVLNNGDIGSKCECGRLFQDANEGGVDTNGLLICGQCLHDEVQLGITNGENK